MPELPEVETVRRQLQPLVVGQRISQVELTAPSLLKNCEVDFFESGLAGNKILDLHRRGKYLIWQCEHFYAVFHLGMSGIFLSDRSKSLYPQHIHLSIMLENGGGIYYQDFRRFGKIWLYKEWPKLKNLGVDPIVNPPSLSDFSEMLLRKSRNIKLFLMDQGQIAGIGNIYASEMLHAAALSPYRKTDSLNQGEIEALYKAMLTILEAAIENFGTTYSAYQTVAGESGENQHFLNVYQLDGQACSRCDSIIEKVQLGNRSTFYCKNCQH